MRLHDSILMLLALGGVSCLLSPAVASSSCNFQTLLNRRKEWAADDEPCHQKLSFDLWLMMKADGVAADADAQHVLTECLSLPAVNHVQLSVDEEWEHVPANGHCGFVVHKGKTAAAFAYKTAADLEAMCSDAGISRASRVIVGHHNSNIRGGSSKAASGSRRRLKTSLSEAGEAHQVDQLIAGLQDLGCTNIQGEGQVYCAMSDSFNRLDFYDLLLASGDLPPDVEIVKELPDNEDGTDEGSAMMELAYDIAPGASYKFNTASITYTNFAEDVTALSTTHGCDVIVDDIRYVTDPSFSDGPLSKAIDAAVEDNNILYFTSGGNYGQGIRFTFNMVCVTGLTTPEIDSPPCTTGLATHLVDDTAQDNERYVMGYTSLLGTEEYLMLHWDDVSGGVGSVQMFLWADVSGEYEFVSTSTATDADSKSTGLVTPAAPGQYYVSVHMTGEWADTAVEMHLLHVSPPSFGVFDGASDSSMFGNACASKAITTAAMYYNVANGGAGGAFSDPETSSVQPFSSRGGCRVRDDAGVLEDRMKPDTTAADGLSTSTPGFEQFNGTSAAAPVAAAIATLIRAACAPEKVVGYDEMMEMLTDDAYAIDYTADEVTPGDMWGVEGGYGIISATQMLDWVKVNCAQACPGSAPTPAVSTPTAQPIVDTAPTTTEPAPTVTAPVEPVPVPTPAPVDGSDTNDGTIIVTSVTSSGYDHRSSDEGGCGEDGCLPILAYDGITEDEESRWSCKEDIVPGRDNCELRFDFMEPLDIAHLVVHFWEWDTRTRRLKVSVNGDTLGSFQSSSDSESTSFDIDTHDVKKLSLESIGLDKDEWVDLLEVTFYLKS